jgi:putative membrane protein
MKLYLLSLSALLVCGCRKDVDTAEKSTSYNPPVGENPADPVPNDRLPVTPPPNEPLPPVHMPTPPVNPEEEPLREPPSDSLADSNDTGVILPEIDPNAVPPDAPPDVAPPEAPAPFLTPADQKFVQQAAYCSLFEIQSSQLVLEKSSSDPHRRFAQTMVDDHGRSNKELADLVRLKGGDVPSTLDSAHQRMLDDLSKLDATQLDTAYRDAQVTVHDEAIRLFDGASSSVDDPELLDFAQRALPSLRDHRRELDGLHENP